MISTVNNHKTTEAVPRAPTQAQAAAAPAVAQPRDNAPHGRGRASAPETTAAAEPERSRGRARERGASETGGAQAPRVTRDGREGRTANTAGLRLGRVPAAEDTLPTLPPILAARADRRRALNPAQTLPASSHAQLQMLAPPGANMPLEMDRYLSDLPEEAFLPHLSFRKKCAIINEALTLDNTLDYSTAALVLAASRRARQQEKQLGREVRYAEVVREVPMGAREMVKTYRGGTCFSLAGHLMGHIKTKFNVPSYALIAEKAPLQMAFWPSLLRYNTFVGIQDIKSHVSGIGHTDVVVPYLQGHDRRALILPTGQSVGMSYQDESISHRVYSHGPERLLTKPHALAFRSLWGRVRMHIAKRQDDSIFGIDFFASEMFINSSAAKNLQVLMENRGAEPHDLTFERRFVFAGLVRRDALSQSEEEAADWTRCLNFLALVNRVFQLEKEALNDIVHVIDRRQSYLEDMVHPWAVALRDTAHERKVALTLSDQLNQQLVKHEKTAQRQEVRAATHNLRLCLDLAQTEVLAGDVDEARADYVKARHHAEAGLRLFAERRA